MSNPQERPPEDIEHDIRVKTALDIIKEAGARYTLALRQEGDARDLMKALQLSALPMTPEIFEQIRRVGTLITQALRDERTAREMLRSAAEVRREQCFERKFREVTRAAYAWADSLEEKMREKGIKRGQGWSR